VPKHHIMKGGRGGTRHIVEVSSQLYAPTVLASEKISDTNWVGDCVNQGDILRVIVSRKPLPPAGITLQSSNP
jgi:hypothetical protein